MRNGAGQALLQCFADEVRADAACILIRNGLHELADRGPGQVVSIWDPGEFGGVDAWLDGEFLARLIDSDEPILESGNGNAAAAAQTNGGQGSIAHALAAVVPSPEGVEVLLCAGFVRPPKRSRQQLHWAVGSFAVAAALCVNDNGGFTEALSWSRRDPLTGCLGYAGLLEALDEEIDRSARKHHRLSCCFVDLDGFKQVNEAGGHLEGNRVLASIGVALRDGVRAYDLVGRFGGDEFVLILPETDIASACKLAERLRVQLRDATYGATAGAVEVSIGTAEWTEGMSRDDLLESADQSLGVAKDRGGSTVVSGSSPDDGVASIHEIFHDVTELMHRGDQQPTQDPEAS